MTPDHRQINNLQHPPIDHVRQQLIPHRLSRTINARSARAEATAMRGTGRVRVDGWRRSLVGQRKVVRVAPVLHVDAFAFGPRTSRRAKGPVGALHVAFSKVCARDVGRWGWGARGGCQPGCTAGGDAVHYGFFAAGPSTHLWVHWLVVFGGAGWGGVRCWGTKSNLK